jgi:hypothetical protein
LRLGGGAWLAGSIGGVAARSGRWTRCTRAGDQPGVLIGGARVEAFASMHRKEGERDPGCAQASMTAAGGRHRQGAGWARGAGDMW